MKFFAAISSITLAFWASNANAGIECITKVSNSVKTPDFHCAKHCSDWANTRPLQSLTLEMDKKWKNMGAFFKNSTATCTGGALCAFASIPNPAISSDAESVTLTFKTWSRPVVVAISADICVMNKDVPAVPEVTPPKPHILPKPLDGDPKQKEKLPKAPIPPQKLNTIEEAGPLAGNCDRLKANWNTEATGYCSPHHVNLLSSKPICSERPDKLFRAVSGVIVCMQ
jgi:hypothetical protein